MSHRRKAIPIFFNELLHSVQKQKLLHTDTDKRYAVVSSTRIQMHTTSQNKLC